MVCITSPDLCPASFYSCIYLCVHPYMDTACERSKANWLSLGKLLTDLCFIVFSQKMRPVILYITNYNLTVLSNSNCSINAFCNQYYYYSQFALQLPWTAVFSEYTWFFPNPQLCPQHCSLGFTYSTSICIHPTQSPRLTLNVTSFIKFCLISPSSSENHFPRVSKAYLGDLSYDESHFALLKLCVPVFSSLINCELTSLTPTPRQNYFLIHLCIPPAFRRVTF